MEESEGEGAPSRLLWVGNVAAEVSEALLIQVFGKYGAVDNVSAYPARSYAFVEFRNLEDSKEAKAGLQGRLVKGHSLRIEYARPAKPSRHLWIWGVSERISKEQLEAEFKNFGPLDDFRLLRDRNSALAEFKNLEDASAAMKGLNKKIIHGEELRVDFLRSQIGKRGGYAGVEPLPQSAIEEKITKEGEPSETLWIGFPPPSKVDEEGLRRAFILFGEVERITTFPDRSYCFVQFRNVDEATRAKEGLQGRLLNDPRVLIRFSSNEGASRRTGRAEGPFLAPLHQRGLVTHIGPRPAFGAFEWSGPNSPSMSVHSSNRYSAPQHDNRPSKGFARPAGGGGILATPPGRGGIHNARAMPSDGNEFFVSSGDVMATPIREDPGDYTQRERKRAKVGYSEGVMEGNSVFDGRHVEGRWIGADSPWQPPYPNALPDLHMYNGGFAHGNTDPTYTPQETGALWKGSIAKAGMFVCRVQSFAVGKGIEGSLPGVVNCVARTSLDMLAQHFSQATDYGVIYFVPNGDSESGSFKEFVNYLGDKRRAGVAKTSDGTSLFLVPPSDFVEKALKLHGDCLYGLVFKSHQQGESAPANYHHPPTLPSHPQQSAYVEPMIATRDGVTSFLGGMPMLETGKMIPPSQSESPPVGSSSASLLSATRIRPLDDVAVTNGTSTTSNAFREAVLAQVETRGSISGSIQDQIQNFPALWSSSLPQAHYPDSTNANVDTSEAGSPGARPTGAMEQAIANLQSGLGDSTSATQALLRQALLTQRHSVDAADSANVQEASNTGVLRPDGALEGEASNRFQATLQLAAALLQRMHNVSGSGGATS